MKAKHGFTLVEILIVVVILGILAAIVIPQFTDAATESKNSSLVSDLQTMRSQIQLYKIQHNDVLPGQDASGTFVTAMTTITDQYGNPAVANAPGAFGPYMRAIPGNPFVDPPADVTVTEGTGTPPTGAGGWYFNTDTGAINADDTGTLNDTAKTPHASL
jgi:general secretion pathway protein G